LSARGYARAKDLAAWKKHVQEVWEKVSVVSVDIDATTLVADLGATMNATAEVALGDLAPNEVSVELLHGPVTASDDLAHWQVVRMDREGPTETAGVDLWKGSFECDVAGRHGFTVRVLPSNADLPAPAELGLEAWAKSS
jgi:glycogen phosphorylase